MPMVTIAEVAAAAGVSPSTVSRTFAAPDLVKPPTRERVLAVGERLGYAPNPIARSLALGRTASIGVIVPDIANPFFAEIVKATQARSARKGYTALLADTDENETEEYEIAEAVLRQVDGLVLVAPRMADAHVLAIAARIPTVLVNRVVPGLPAVTVPARDGMGQAVAHAAALGHRHCSYVAGPEHSWSNHQRQLAMRAACKESEVRLTEFGPFEARFESGVHAADLVRAAGATCVVAHNDMVALGLLARFTDRGIAVPQDISVIGVDDTLLARSSNPLLTSVRLPLRDMGRQAVDLIVDSLGAGDGEEPAVIELDSQLRVRRSTGPAPR
ncbi:MAG TPA: LacI family DNA-binding transcriptional regulator [Mycobacteriales bacterium]|nr:LacI family DNA-binding transcriptional regulator [Mycobacteriales bacterium]